MVVGWVCGDVMYGLCRMIIVWLRMLGIVIGIVRIV